jgi:rubrerythrin
MHTSFTALLDDAAQLEHDKAKLERENVLLRQRNGQMQQHNTALHRELIERTVELNTAKSQLVAAASQAEHTITVKQAMLDALTKARSSAQQAEKAGAGKRKAESALESEAKRRRALEGELNALAESMDEKDKCIVCLDKQPDVLFLRCRHLVCCSVCAGSLRVRRSSGATCPQCQAQFAAKDVIKVFRA